MLDAVVHRRSAVRLASLGFVLALAASGCSFSIGSTPESVAEDLIEGDLADQAGLSDVTATCETPPDREPGTTFTCTSPSEIGEIRWLATMEDEDTVNVASENLLFGDDVTSLEQGAVAAFQDGGLPVSEDDFDCGEPPIVIGADGVLACTLTEPATGDVYDTDLTITDLETGTFDLAVAEEPRSG